MKKRLLIIVILLLVGCEEQLPKFDEYSGRPLNLAVIGAAPDIREKNVTFEEYSMDDLLFMDFTKHDAVFVMKENLEDASASQYAEIYTSSGIPVFFIESTKGTYPFVNADETYSTSTGAGDNLIFADGYLPMSDPKVGSTTYKFGLYNDIKNDETIKGTYSIIFTKIEEILK